MFGLPTQNQHLIRLNTVLGENVLLVDSFRANMSMSSMFDMRLHVYSDIEHNIEPDKLIGTATTISIIDEFGLPVYFNGFITRFSKDKPAETGNKTQYFLEVKPWLYYLDNETDCRIFQSNTVKDVIDKVFEKWQSIGSYSITLKRNHPVKRFWVQYNETSYDFFNRICHIAGLAYYFTFENGQHHLHIIDDASSLPNLEPQVINYQPGTRSRDHIVDWKRASKYVTGNYEQRSYSYKMPSTLLTSKDTAKGDPAAVPRVMETEQYIYSEEYTNFSEGSADTSIRALQGTAKHNVVHGHGDCRHIQLGHHFSVMPVPVTTFFPDKGKPFTFIGVNVSANNEGTFRVDFAAVPKGELSYPAAKKVVIPGMQTAVVTGPKGEEIHMDPEGRIKVQFHWDRQGKQDENTTCWLRVMQSFAGPNFGSQFTPRIGQEVVVAFENGNPDRPFVIGALYHPENPPPYKDHKGTRNGIRTRSTKGGGTANCNELYFEDTKGSEEVYFQAEKDHNALVKNDQQIKIGHNKAQQVAKNETNKVGENYTINVGKKLLIEAGQEIKLQVGGSTITITGSKIDISAGVVDINGAIKLN